MATTISTDSPKLTADVASRAEVYGGRGLVFDGVSDYLDCGDLTSTTRSNMTISLWLYRGASGTVHICSRDDESSNRNWSMYIYSDNINFDFLISNSGKNTAGNSTIAVNSWTHLAFTHNGSNQVIYVNGKSDGTSSHSGTIDNDSVNMYIGRRAGNYLNGKISDFKVFDTALTEAQVQELYLKPEQSAPSAVQSNLKAWYPMCEGLAQSVAYDHSGNNNHAVEGGGSSYTLAVAQNEPLIPQVPLMKYAEKMIFDGSDDKVTLSGSSPSTAFTISSWVIDNHPSGSDFSAIYSTASLYIWFGVDNNSTTGKVRIHLNGTPYADTPNGSFEANKLTHIVATWDAIGGGTNNINGVKIYINGTSQTLTVVNSLSTPTASTDHKIGMYGASNQWNGLIDETSIFNTALTQTQVTELYNSGVSLDATTHSKSGNLLGYWRNDGVSTWQDRRGWSYLNFDGTGDFVQLPMSFSQTTFSISVWYNANSGDKYIFDAREIGGNDGITLALNASGTFWYAIRGTTSNAISSTAGSLNQWNHALVTYDGSTAHMYLNGSDVTPSGNSFSCVISTTINARIGALAYSTFGYFDGDIASVGLYTTVKTQAEAQTIFNQGFTGSEATNSGIFAYYKLDTASTSSGAVKDLVGTNHGTVNGNPTLNTGNTGTVAGTPNSVTIREGLTSGKDGLNFPLKNPSGNVLRLNGVNEYVNLKTLNKNIWKKSFTLSFWMKPTDGQPSSSQIIMGVKDSSGADSNVEAVLKSDGEIRLKVEYEGTTKSGTSDSAVYADKESTWKYINMVQDADSESMILYVNDSIEASNGANLLSGVDIGSIEINKDFFIGGRSVNGTSIADLYNGLLDEVRIYNRALSLAEIQKNYKHQKGKHKND